jgi:hypothetical protein
VTDAVCSTGPITFDNSSSIVDYHGLIVRLKGFHAECTLASALGSIKGSNGTEVPATIQHRQLRTMDRSPPIGVMY